MYTGNILSTPQKYGFQSSLPKIRLSVIPPKNTTSSHLPKIRLSLIPDKNTATAQKINWIIYQPDASADSYLVIDRLLKNFHHPGPRKPVEEEERRKERRSPRRQNQVTKTL